MAEYEHSIEVDAPPEEVFDYIADPTNHQVFTPSLTDVPSVEENDVGKRGEYVFSRMGVSLEGTFEDVAFDRPSRRKYELAGDLEGDVTWTIRESNGGSTVRYESNLSVSGPEVLDTLTKPVQRRMNNTEIESLLGNLQAVLEEGDR